MGPGFVILIWLILAGIYGCIFLAFVGIWFWGRKKNIKWLKWLGKVSAIGMATIALLVVVITAGAIVRSMNPRWVFKQTFDTKPPPSVSKIQSSFFYFADGGEVYLRFHGSQEEFVKLIPTNLVKKTAEEMKSDTPIESGNENPKWWDYKIQSDWIYYLRIYSGFKSEQSGPKGFFNETEYMAYDPKQQIVYYRFQGID